MNTRLRLFVMLLVFGSVGWGGISEDFDGQSPPSTNSPPSGWNFIKVEDQAGTFYEAVSDHGGIAGRVKCDVVHLTQYPPGYLVNSMGFDATLAIKGSYDFMVEDEGAWSDGLFMMGDIFDGLTADFYVVKYQYNTPSTPTVISKSQYVAGQNTTMAVLAGGTGRVIFGTWYSCEFTWEPISGTTGVFTTNTIQSNGTVLDILSATITLPETAYIGFSSANDALRIDNVEIDYKPGAIAIEPAEPENVSLDTLLKWEFVPEGYPVLYYDVWFGTDPNQIPGESWKQLVYQENITEVDPASPESAWGTDLLNGVTYYWRVDAYEPNTVGTLLIPGEVWSFATIPPTPIVTGQPEDLMVDLGEDAVFAIVASDATSYAWYKNDVLIATDDPGYQGADTDTLTVLAVDGDDDGWYHCVPENSAGPANPPSEKAALTVKRLMANWKFDQATDLAGQYTDSAEEHHALLLEPNTALTYVAGVDGDAIQMDAMSIANGGTWDPSATSNQITVSCWVNWTTSGGYQGIVGKADGWTTSNRWYWRTDLDVARLRWFRNSSYGPDITLTVNQQWQFICMTVADGVATGYVNGLQIGTANFSFGGGVADPIWIGRAENHPDRWFNGAIDDLRIYNYAIGPEAVIEEYNRLIDPDISTCLYPDQVGAGDVNGDCKVDLVDFALLTESWLNCGIYPVSFCE